MSTIRRVCGIGAVLAMAATAVHAAESLTLATGGKARLPVVISGAAGPEVKLAADELAKYLGQMAGVSFTVQTGDGREGIVVGTLAEFPDPALNEPLAIRDTFDGKEAFAIRTEPRRLRLIGATELGASHAVYRLLDRLGCRWLFPAPEWEVVPRRAEVTVAIDETDRPAILSRRIWWGYGFFSDDKQRCRRDYEDWSRRNLMASSRRIWCGHAWQSIIGDNRAVFAAHPEYLALVKDKRQEPQLCVSNPAVRQLAAEWALGQLRRRPELDMVSLETSDGSNHCECAGCRQLGSISDRVFGLANEVARAVAREFPGKMVGMYAYNDHCEPPSFALEPNVYVQSTAGFIRGRYTFEELMERWPKVAKSFGFYEYFSVWLWDFDMLPGGNGANAKHIVDRIRAYRRVGATSLDCESGNNWGVHGRGYYLANKLMWNPEADPQAILADFYQQAFGPAAAVMQRYYERLDPGNEPLLSTHLVGLALRDVDEAAGVAGERPDVLARLTHIKQYLHYVRLRWEHDRTKDKPRRQELALAALTHVYRTRFSYMNHWQAMRGSWFEAAEKEFAKPEWLQRQAWKDDTPLTAADTERQFREDLDFFRLQPLEERTFSTKLVPSGFQTDKPAASWQQYQKGCRYALYSRDGEPLEFAIKTGIIAWYRDRADARYSVTDAAGRTITSGRLPQDGEEHPLRIAVPAAGLFWLDFNDQAAGWGLRVAAGKPVAVALQRGKHPSHMGHMQRMYFFVPRGTRTLHYFWQGGPHEVLGPDGRLVTTVETSGQFVSVSIPEGTDGRVWSLSKLALGHLWFLNAPNYLAASPDALLVPTELK